MPQKELNHRAQDHEEGRIDIIVARLTGFSRARVRGLMLHGGVVCNTETTGDAGQIVREGDAIKVTYDPIRQYRDAPKNPVLPLKTAKTPSSGRSFQIVYQDETLIVVNKEAGLLTVPTDKRESQNLLDLLSRQAHPQRKTKLGLVHRLDRETSGLLVFGQDQRAAAQLIEQFAERKPERIYNALVKGKVQEDEGTIRSHLESDKALNQRSSVRNQGELAITHFKVLERFSDVTLIEVRLETGRRNQIRVHFAEKGHPVLGDLRYQSEKARHQAWPYKRLALHARVLGFEHPRSGDTMRFEQDLPKEFTAFLKVQKRS